MIPSFSEALVLGLIVFYVAFAVVCIRKAQRPTAGPWWRFLVRWCVWSLLATLFAGGVLAFRPGGGVEQARRQIMTAKVREGDSKIYENDEFGISFRYPAAWNLYTKEAPGPFMQSFDENQLLFCSSPASESTNFNIRLAKGPPPRPFVPAIEPTLNQVVKTLNATRLSYRGTTVAGSEAAEMVISYMKPGSSLELKQKMMVVARPAVGFIWWFTAPLQHFGDVDLDVFVPVLQSVLFTDPSAPVSLWYGMPPWVRGAVLGGGLPLVVLTGLTALRRITRKKRIVSKSVSNSEGMKEKALQGSSSKCGGSCERESGGTAREHSTESLPPGSLNCKSCDQTFFGTPKAGDLCPLCGGPLAGAVGKPQENRRAEMTGTLPPVGGAQRSLFVMIWLLVLVVATSAGVAFFASGSQVTYEHLLKGLVIGILAATGVSRAVSRRSRNGGS